MPELQSAAPPPAITVTEQEFEDVVLFDAFAQARATSPVEAARLYNSSAAAIERGRQLAERVPALIEAARGVASARQAGADAAATEAFDRYALLKAENPFAARAYYRMSSAPIERGRALRNAVGGSAKR